ncbi:MAG TPA: hypothetical protein VEJ18_12985 [Planctomycetota bacterium]|nr:hypothetical protein [Planctomycetota bacterium]
MALLIALELAVQAGTGPGGPPADDWRVLTFGRSKLTFYGFLRLDVLYDTARMAHPQLGLWVLSKDLPGGDGAAAGRSDFTMHPRLTRFGIDFEGPRVPDIGEPGLTGKLEIDFYNLLSSVPTSSSNSREFLRLRHAWLKLDWDAFSFLAGQREDVAAPLSPTPNWDMVMWGAGNPGDRRPQIRPELKAGPITFTGLIGVTGAQDNANLDDDPATPGLENAFFDGEASGLPTLQVRMALEAAPAGGRPGGTLGVWAHWSRDELDVPLAADGDRRFESTAVGLDLTLHLAEWLWIKGELWSGKNVDDIRGGIFQGVNIATGDEIDAAGGWVEAGFPVLPWYTPVVGVSMDDPDDTDLTASAARDLNRVHYVAQRFRFGPVEAGADWMRWKTEYAGGSVRGAVDHRFSLFFAYHF